MSDQRRSSGLSFTQTTDDSAAIDIANASSLHDDYGYIESLTISNFKSYYGETVIGPFSPFTCIIGPNGSGKSNLMDAISFVLGIKTQQLRGKKLTDLIHRINFSQNSSNKSQSPQIKPTKAFVELTYVSKKSKKANQRHNDDEDDEDDDIENNENEEYVEQRMIFRRTITNEGITINQCNGERMTYSKYEEQLSKIGVIVKARNFLVFQGDVTNIAQKTGKQLTKWFEQISGSDALKHEYDEARKEQQRISNEYEAVNERNRNLAKEKKQMKQQRDEATTFQKTQQELMDLKSEYYRFQLFHIIKDVQSARQDIENQDAEIEESNDTLKDLEDEIKLKQADLSKSLRKKTNINKTLKKMKQTLNKKKLKADSMEKQCQSLKKEQSRLDSEEEKLNELMETNNEEITELKQEINDLEDDRNEYEERLKDQAQDIELEENEYEIYQDIKNTICQETASMNLRKSTLNNVYSRLNDGFNAKQNEIDILNKRQEKLNTNIDDINISISNLKVEQNQIESEYKETQKEFGEMTEKRKEFENERVIINNKLEKLRNELKEMDIGIQDNMKEKQQYEVLQTLQKLFSGIYGKLCDLVIVRQQRYELSVAAGLGLNHDAIVVENKEIAKKCMEHMRKSRRGHFRFIPLNDIKTYPVSQAMRRFGGTAQPMMDVIDYEPQFERAVQFALSNTIVVDNIEEARKIAYSPNNGNNDSQYQQRVRVVSLDGSIIQPNGNISGGASKDLRDKARRFNEKERTKKYKLRDELLSQLKHVDDELMGDDDQKSMEEVQNVLNELENQRKEKQLRIQTFKKQLKEKQTMLKALKKDLKSKRSELKRQQKEVDAAKQELDECDQEIEQKEQELFSEVAEELGVSTLREYEEQKLQRIEQRSEKRKEFNVRLTELENKCKFVENKNKENKAEIKRIAARLKKIRSELKEIEGKRLKKLKKEIEKEEGNVENEEKRSDDIHDECKQKRKLVSDKKKEIDMKRKEITEKMHKKSELKGWIARLSHTQKNIMKQAKHERVELKSKKQLRRKKAKKKRSSKRAGHRRKRRKKNDGESSDEQESDDLDEEEDDDEEEEEQRTDDEDLMDEDEYDENEEDDMQIQEMMERRMTGIDFSEFERKQNAMDEDQEEEEEGEAKEAEMEFEAERKHYLTEIRDLTNRLRELQPNMKALQQYKKIQTKWKDGNTEHKQMRKKVTAVNAKVDKLTTDRSNKLMECFEIIQTHIKHIYAELTKSSQYKKGGRAFLNMGSAINAFDDEIVFSAMPPGKPFREMQQLSGGEKSVASLALLFAIHSYKPSPFFILDEIDAALDQKNVQRVCNYIQKKSKQNTQIIVISLKDKFFSNADSLIGVCKDRTNGDSSMVLSIDLTRFESNGRNQRRLRQQQREDDEKRGDI